MTQSKNVLEQFKIKEYIYSQLVRLPAYSDKKRNIKVIKHVRNNQVKHNIKKKILQGKKNNSTFILTYSLSTFGIFTSKKEFKK